MILRADARAIPLADRTVQTVVTSPPYWGLRDYGTARWDGGDASCNHLAGALCSDKSTLAGFTSENIKLRTNGMPFRDFCGKCGARRVDSQIGLEPTPEDYVATMVAVFREVGRVLKDDGTVWLNLGDSYASDTKGSGGASAKQDNNAGSRYEPIKLDHGLKPKDLCGIPWRVAFALQADGWYLRSDIIWAKPNPMPESVTDRPTRSHEYIFLLTKSARYFYDTKAIMEPAIHAGKIVVLGEKSLSKGQANGRGITASGNGTADSVTVADGRNRRDVWTINSEPTPEAHFATFPSKLVEPCILAGTSAKGECVQCGKNWVRVTEQTASTRTRLRNGLGQDCEDGTKGRAGEVERITTGWRPQCTCFVLRCGGCGYVLDSSDANTVGLSRMSEGFSRQSEDSDSEILQPDLRESLRVSDTPDDSRLCHNGEGLSPALQAGASDSEPDRLHHGASVGDGADARTPIETDRSGPSQERDQGRQPARKSRSNGKARTRQGESGRRAMDSDVPALQTSVSDAGQCPKCKSGSLAIGPAPTRPNLVADIFLGSGTVGKVAEKLGRRWAGTELSAEYIEIAKKRTRQMGLRL